MVPQDSTVLRLPDLSAMRRDQHSFLARVLSVGADLGRWPAQFEETFATFLRAQALVIAQRQRTGIALGRDAMRLGLGQAWGCLELGLENRSGNDVERALSDLTDTSLVDLHRAGYEVAFRRLHEMQSSSSLLVTSQDTAVCADLHENFERWCNLTPETWVLRLSDGSSTTVDPTRDYEAFITSRTRLQFIRSFPVAVRRRLREADTTIYPDLLRRVIIALALHRDNLDFDTEQIEMARRIFHPSSADAEQRKELQRLLETHLRTLFETADERVVLHQDVSEALACLVEASPDATTFLLTVDERLADGEFVVDDPVAAAQAFDEDLRAQ